MPGISQLRRGRGMISRAKRLHLRRRQPRFAGKQIRSAFRLPPRKPRPTQPYLGSGVDLSQLLG
jgi:hypothetical protein